MVSLISPFQLDIYRVHRCCLVPISSWYSLTPGISRVYALQFLKPLFSSLRLINPRQCPFPLRGAKAGDEILGMLSAGSIVYSAKIQTYHRTTYLMLAHYPSSGAMQQCSHWHDSVAPFHVHVVLQLIILCLYRFFVNCYSYSSCIRRCTLVYFLVLSLRGVLSWSVLFSTCCCVYVVFTLFRIVSVGNPPLLTLFASSITTRMAISAGRNDKLYLKRKFDTTFLSMLTLLVEVSMILNGPVFEDI